MFTFIKSLLTPKADVAKLVREGAMIVDVRTSSEYKEAHLAGSINIPLDTIKNGLNELKQRNVPVVTVCRSGARSARATSLLTAAGINAVNGGAWKQLQSKIKSS